MSTSAKIWLIVAVSLILLGSILFTGVMLRFKWDFTKLSTVKYEMNTHEIREDFHSLSIKTDTAHITFAPSDNSACRVECYETQKATHSVTAREGTLTIELHDERSVYDYIGINIGAPSITVYLPKAAYTSLLIRESTDNIAIPTDFHFESVDISLSTGDVDFYGSASGAVRIKASTGDIHVENITAGALDLSVSTGKVVVTGVNCEGDLTIGVSTGKSYLTDVACENILSSGSTGDISLTNTLVTEMISVERSTGDVKFDGCDAAEIVVKTDTGDVTGRLLTDKVFVTETDTGHVDVPKTATGGRCEIHTDTGDIAITVG